MRDHRAGVWSPGRGLPVARLPAPAAVLVATWVALVAPLAWDQLPDRVAQYYLEAPVPSLPDLRQRFTEGQLALVEKIN